MSDEIREQLSALVDDEIDELEQPMLLGRLQRDSRLREILGRYQLISEVMRGDGQAATLGIAERVRRALEQEQDIALPEVDKPHPGGLGWLKPIAGLAVAASVALLAVLAVTSVREPAVETPPRVASTQHSMPVTGGNEELWERIEPRIDKRMAAYLVNHNEYAASRGVQGVMPYVRIIGYENKRQ